MPKNTSAKANLPWTWNPGVILAAAAAVALLVVGVIGAAKEWPTAGVVVIFLVAVVLIIFTAVHPRLGTIDLGATKEGVSMKMTLDQKVMDELERAGINAVAATYRFVHDQLADDPESKKAKIDLQDALVKVAQDNAFQHPVDAAEVKNLILTGSIAERVISFGLLTTHPQFATRDLLVQGVRDSASGNEQFHALKATAAAWNLMSAEDQAALLDAIEKAPYLTEDSDRRKIAEKIKALPRK
jgi:hypothetical protein